jgi:hypothetical protein
MPVRPVFWPFTGIDLFGECDLVRGTDAGRPHTATDGKPPISRLTNLPVQYIWRGGGGRKSTIRFLSDLLRPCRRGFASMGSAGLAPRSPVRLFPAYDRASARGHGVPARVLAAAAPGTVGRPPVIIGHVDSLLMPMGRPAGASPKPSRPARSSARPGDHGAVPEPPAQER